MISVAVDVMGGDGGLATCLDGVIVALEQCADLSIVAVGSKDDIEAQLKRYPKRFSERVSIVDASHVLSSDVSPAEAIRHGQDSSMALAIRLHQEKKVEAVVSGGSTAGLMALSRQMLGMMPGVERPALMTRLPTVGADVWVLDLGANVGVDAQRLHEFAMLGSQALTARLGYAPSIGLLNIGTEKNKGPDVLREAARLIEDDANLSYQGFIEADQVFQGEVDLVVCDGFAGNVLLKAAEGGVRLVIEKLRRQFKATLLSRLLGHFVRSRLLKLYETLHPSQHNGAPLLGIEGLVIKSHGSADVSGFARAIVLAYQELRHQHSQ